MPAPATLARVCSYCRAAIGPDDARLPTSHGACAQCSAAARQALDDDEPMGAAALETALLAAREQANRWHSDYVSLRQRHDHALQLLASASADVEQAWSNLQGGDPRTAANILRRQMRDLASRPSL